MGERFRIQSLYPQQHDGSLTGLAERAVRWHRDTHRRQLEEVMAEYGGEQPVALPPIALPDHPGLRFLRRISRGVLRVGGLPLLP